MSKSINYLSFLQIYTIAFISSFTIISCLGQRLEPKKWLQIGLLSFGIVLTFISFLANHIVIFVLALILLGLAAALVLTTVYFYILTLFSENARQLAVSIWASIILIGSISKNLISNIIFNGTNAMAFVYVIIVLVTISLFLNHFCLPKQVLNQKIRVNLISTLLFTVAMALFTWSFLNLTTLFNKVWIVILLGFSLISIGRYIVRKRESRHFVAKPVQRKFIHRVLPLLPVLVVFFALANIDIIPFLYINNNQNTSISYINVLIIMSLFTLIVGVMVSLLNKWLVNKYIILLGILVIGLMVIIQSFSLQSTSYWLLFIVLGLFIIGAMVTFVVSSMMFSQGTNKDHNTLAISSLFNHARELALIMGTSLFSFYFNIILEIKAKPLIQSHLPQLSDETMNINEVTTYLLTQYPNDPYVILQKFEEVRLSSLSLTLLIGGMLTVVIAALLFIKIRNTKS